MHIGQGFISLKGEIKIAALNNDAQPRNMSKNRSLGLADVMVVPIKINFKFLVSFCLKRLTEYLFVFLNRPVVE